jgi:hypothetical protein
VWGGAGSGGRGGAGFDPALEEETAGQVGCKPGKVGCGLRKVGCELKEGWLRTEKGWLRTEGRLAAN